MLKLEAERQGGKLFMKRILSVLMMVTMMISSFMAIPANATTDESTTENPYLIEYKGNQYIVPPLSLNRKPGVTESGYVEKYTEVPQYFQTLYPDVTYGDSNIAKSGCGVVCDSMALTYILDEEVTVETLAKEYNYCKVEGGSSFNLFYDSAKDRGVTVSDSVWNWEPAKEALKNGQIVIANCRQPGTFTKGAHFILLSGFTEDGKIVVRDPNLNNYVSTHNDPVREKGFAEGFDESTIKNNCQAFFIYEKKDLEAVAKRFEESANEENTTASEAVTNP